ncbi:MAG: right-handed parallel beta-helix repeat-containing protein [Pseudomonadota bacterium]
MVTMTHKVSHLAIGAGLALAFAAPSIAAAQNTFGGQPVNNPPAVEYAEPKTTTTFIVEDGGRGRYQKISQALADAKDGDVIKVRSGIYDELGLMVDKSVTILSEEEGERRPIVRVGGNSRCLTQTGRDVETFVVNMVFVSDSAESCIVVNNGSFAMQDSAVYDNDHLPPRMDHFLNGEGFSYGAADSFKALNAGFTDASPDVMIKVNGGRVNLSRNHVFGGTRAAVAVSESANSFGAGPSGVSLMDNVIQHSDLHGVLISGSVDVNFVSNEISQNGDYTKQAPKRGNNKGRNATGSKDQASNGYGIYSVGYGTISLTDNEVRRNRNGIYFGDASGHVSLQGNTVNGNVDTDMFVGAISISMGVNDVGTPRGRSKCSIIDHTTAGVFSDGDRRSRGKVCRN